MSTVVDLMSHILWMFEPQRQLQRAMQLQTKLLHVDAQDENRRM